MKVSHLVESNADTVISGYIAKILERCNVEGVFGGNCGTFALALAHKLTKDGFPAKLAFVYREGGEESIQDVVEAEPDVYHVVVALNGKYYDGEGETTQQGLVEFAYDEYGDKSPGLFIDIGLDEPGIDQLIRTETNWSISSETFMKILDDR